MSDPTIRVVDALTGQTWEYPPTLTACAIQLEKLVNGDGSVGWTLQSFTQFTDTLPSDHAVVYVEDDLGEIQRARLIHADPPDTSLCTGPARFTAEGDGARLGDQKFDADVAFGPQFPGGPSTVATTPEAMVEYAISQNVPLVSIQPTVVTGYTLPGMESVLGRTAHDVVNTAIATSAGSATPHYWSVKKGVFRYQTLDLAARYEVSIAGGAICAPKRDATRKYNRVIVMWGQDQVVTYPDTLSYVRIPTQVDLIVNAGSELYTEAAALRLAAALYAKLEVLELGWTWTVTVPGTTQIQKLFPGDTGPLSRHYRMDAGYFLRIPDLDPIGRYGPKHPSPTQLLMTHVRWSGERNETVITCGEMRDPSERTVAVVRDIMYRATSPVVHALQTPGLNIARPNANKLNAVGQQSATATADLTTSGGAAIPQPIRAGTVQQAAKQRTVDPSALPPLPPLQQFQDGTPDTSGVKTKIGVPPMKVLSWSALTSGIQSDYAGTWTRRSNGAVVASFNLAGSSEKVNQAVGSTTVNSTIGVIETDDFLIYTVTTPASSTAVTFVTNTLRCVRHFEGYLVNPHPRTGALAT